MFFGIGMAIDELGFAGGLSRVVVQNRPLIGKRQLIIA